MTPKRRIANGDVYVRVTDNAGKAVFLGCIKDWDVNKSGLDWTEALQDFKLLSGLYVGVGGTRWAGWSLERTSWRKGRRQWTSEQLGEFRRLINEGNSGYQIADIMNMPVSTVYSKAAQLNISFKAARARLREKKERERLKELEERA